LLPLVAVPRHAGVAGLHARLPHALEDFAAPRSRGVGVDVVPVDENEVPVIGSVRRRVRSGGERGAPAAKGEAVVHLLHGRDAQGQFKRGGGRAVLDGFEHQRCAARRYALDQDDAFAAGLPQPRHEPRGEFLARCLDEPHHGGKRLGMQAGAAVRNFLFQIPPRVLVAQTRVHDI